MNSELKIKEIIPIFHAERENFSASAFHKECDGKANTVVIAKTSKDKIIGGYTPVSWESDNYGKFKTDMSQRSFIFSVSNEEKFTLQKKEFAIECNCFSGPVFGKGAFWIQDNSNTNEAYWSEIPTSYKPLNREWSDKDYI